MIMKDNKLRKLSFSFLFFMFAFAEQTNGCERVPNSKFSSGLHALGTENVTAIIIRHAEKDEDKEKLGVLDRNIPLTPDGVNQAKGIGKALSYFWQEEGINYQLLISHSEFVRTTQTAQKLEYAFVGHGDMRAELRPLSKISGKNYVKMEKLIDWMENSIVSQIEIYIEHSGGINELLRRMPIRWSPGIDYAESLLFTIQDQSPVCVARVQWDKWFGLVSSD